MLWVGIVLVVIAAVLFLFSRRATAKVFHIKATETSKIASIQELVGQVAADMPDGMATGYRDYVELKGRVACDEPLRGELSDKMCAVVETVVYRVFERREERRDPQGNVLTEWKKGEETVSSNRREAPFSIDDGTGKLRVKSQTGIELEKLLERFESASAVESGLGGHLTLSLGRFQLSLAGGGPGASSRTLGYKFVERALPVGKTVYALGEVAHTEDDGLVLRPPTDEAKKKPFMISLRTEEELVKAGERNAVVLKIIAGVLAAGGVVLAVLHFTRR